MQPVIHTNFPRCYTKWRTGGRVLQKGRRRLRHPRRLAKWTTLSGHPPPQSTSSSPTISVVISLNKRQFLPWPPSLTKKSLSNLVQL